MRDHCISSLSLSLSFLGKKLADGKGLSGKGRLTLARIDAIQIFFGKAIRKNKCNAQNKAKEIWAILDRCSSTVDQPKHDKCPKGENSWCPYQRNISTGQRTYRPAKWPLTKAIVNVLHPLFIRLTNEGFRDGCKKGSTQNSSKSFNSLVWSRSPKEQYNSPLETSLSISLAVCIYNSGMEYTISSLLKRANMEVDKNSQRQWQLIDEERLCVGNYKNREDIKLKRKSRKRSEMKKQDAFHHEEDKHYQSGAFH